VGRETRYPSYIKGSYYWSSELLSGGIALFQVYYIGSYSRIYHWSSELLSRGEIAFLGSTQLASRLIGSLYLQKRASVPFSFELGIWCPPSSLRPPSAKNRSELGIWWPSHETAPGLSRHVATAFSHDGTPAEPLMPDAAAVKQLRPG
jgi:hypothetical protein